jgi:glycosyltransferase involved in cell wall biosynthesis
MQIIVGTNGNGYVEERNLTLLPFTRARITRSYDICAVLNHVERNWFHSSTATSMFNTFHCDLGVNRVTLLHLINCISSSTTPWIATYSHYLPRWDLRSRYGVSLLSSKHCRKLIAISTFAQNYEEYVLDRFPAYKGDIHRKMCVLHPAQAALINECADKQLDPEVIVCTIVGSDFFRKGGKEILRALDRLRAENMPVRLNIVSTLEHGDYASKSTQEDLRIAKQLIARLGSAVRHYETLPNAAVLDLLRQSHVGLLPTYDDIYGYSVLEAQAAGCPVISTDICALPEINNEQIGWLIEVPKSPFGIALRKTEQQRRILSSKIEEGLYSILRDICLNPAPVREKGLRALKRIKEQCRPETRSQVLEHIYLEALSA